MNLKHTDSVGFCVKIQKSVFFMEKDLFCLESRNTMEQEMALISGRNVLHCFTANLSESFLMEAANTDLEDMKRGNTGELDKASSEEVEGLRQRIKEVENSEQDWQANVSPHLRTEVALKRRIKELQLSEKTLLEEINQLRMNLCRVETTIERVKSRIQNLQAQFTEVVQQQERAAAKHKGKLQRLQNCLRVKEDEVKQQSEYFEHCKQNQKQQIATLREREAGLQRHTGRLEKEIRDLKASVSVLSGELREETWQCLQGEMEAAFSRLVGSLPPSSRAEVAELKLLVEEVQRHIGSYLVELKHQLKSLLGRGGSSETGTYGDEFDGGQGEGSSANLLACKLKPTEINCDMQMKVPQGRDNPLLKHKLLPKEAKRKQVAAGTEVVKTEANNEGLNALLKMKWEEAIDPARNMDSQTLCLMQSAEELCVLEKADTSRWHLSKEELPGGFLIKYLKCSSGPWVAASVEQSPAGTKKAAGDAETAGALRNICLLFGGALVQARRGRGMKGLRGSLPVSAWKTGAVSAVQLPSPEYQRQKVRSSPQTSLTSLPSSISEADGGSILGKDSEAKKKMTENATLKLPDDKPKIRAPNKEKVGRVNGRGQKSWAEEGHWVKYEVGGAPVKSESNTGKDRKAKFPVSHGIPEEVSPVLDEMVPSRTEEEAVKPTCCAGRKGKECKPLSNAGRKEVPPRPADPLAEQGTTFADDPGRSPGKMTISNGQEKQPQTERLEQISLCRHRSERRKENREPECDRRDHGSQEQNSNQGLAPAALETPKGDARPLGLARQDRSECLLKGLPQMTTGSTYSRKISPLTLENAWQLCMVQHKNHRDALKIRALEEEREMYDRYLFAVDDTRATPHQKCFSTDRVGSEEFLEKEMVGDCHGALGALWGKGGGTLPEESFPLAAEREGGRLGKQASSSESRKTLSLEGRKSRYFQLLSCLKDERNHLLKEMTQLVQDEEKWLEQNCKLEEEGARNLQIICLLEGDKESLLRRLRETKGEHQRCAVLISELDGYKNMWFQAAFELEEEKCVWQNSMERMQRETCSKCLESQSTIDNLKLEHEKLVKLMAAQGIDSEEQTPNGGPFAERGMQGVKQENETLHLDSEMGTAAPKTLTAEKATQVTELVCCPVQDTDFEGKGGSFKGLFHEGESKVDNHFRPLLNPAKMLVPLDTHKSFVTGQLQEMNEETPVAKPIGETESQIPTPSSSPCSAKQPGRVGTQEMSGKETISGSTRTVKEQLEKANEELKTQQEKLDKAKKDAQKWYVELGFAETRCEEVSTQLKDALSELQRFKEAEVDRSSVNRPQELVKETFIIQKLEQQVLTFKAQLRDHGALRHQYEALKKEMELLQMQIKEQNEELRRRQSEAKLAAAPFQAKLACLVQKCHQRNCMIARLVQKLGQRGITEGAEEAEELVRDAVLSEYASAFASGYKQESASPPSCPATRGAVVGRAGAREDVGPVAGSISPEGGGSRLARSPPAKETACLSELTSPEKVFNFHRELSKSHGSDYQRAPLNRETTPHLFSSGQRLWDVTSVVSKRRCARGLPQPAHFSPTKRQEQVFQHHDVSQNQMGDLHAGAFDRGMKLKNVLMNNSWLSREKPGGSASIAAPGSHFSDTAMPSSDKCPSPLGEKTAASKRGNPMETTQGLHRWELPQIHHKLCMYKDSLRKP